MKELLFSFSPTIIPKGAGVYEVQPGKPVQWLPTSRAAAALHCHPSSLRRWIDDGSLPMEIDGQQVFRKCGVQKWEFNIPLVRALMDRWTRDRLR